MRDDRPFADPAPLAAPYFYSPDRGAAHPEAHLARWQGGVMQAEAYSGFNRLYEPTRRRDRSSRSPARPMRIEAVACTDALFAVEREIKAVQATECAGRDEFLSVKLKINKSWAFVRGYFGLRAWMEAMRQVRPLLVCVRSCG